MLVGDSQLSRGQMRFKQVDYKFKEVKEEVDRGGNQGKKGAEEFDLPHDLEPPFETHRLRTLNIMIYKLMLVICPPYKIQKKKKPSEPQNAPRNARQIPLQNRIQEKKLPKLYKNHPISVYFS